MPTIRVLQPFKFAHYGYQVEAFEPSSDPRETTQECADLAVREGWAEIAGDSEQPASAGRVKRKNQEGDK